MDKRSTAGETPPLPEGWEWRKLGEVCEVFGGGTPSKKVKEFYIGNIPWATVRDMKGEIIKRTEYRITEEAVKKSSTNIIPKGSVIIATRVGLGKVCLTNEDIAINQDLRGVIPKNSKKLYVPFLFRWFKNISNKIIEEGTGATVKGVKLPFIKGLTIPLPPLAEQKRIVTILDEAFAAIDKAKANAEKNLSNAKELFESYLNGIFANPGEDWEEKKLGDVCDEVFAGGDAPPKDSFSKVENDRYKIPIYANAVKDNGLYGYTNIARVHKPSITIAARGSGTGHTEIRLKPFLPIVRLIVLIPNKELVDLGFLKYVVDRLTILKSGSAIPQLTVPMIRDYFVSFPKLSEQKQIVTQLGKLSAETKRLEHIYQRKITALDELKKTILKKAFEGKL